MGGEVSTWEKTISVCCSFEYLLVGTQEFYANKKDDCLFEGVIDSC
jgi:hypothetical protein